MQQAVWGQGTETNKKHAYCGCGVQSLVFLSIHVCLPIQKRTHSFFCIPNCSFHQRSVVAREKWDGVRTNWRGDKVRKHANRLNSIKQTTTLRHEECAVNSAEARYLLLVPGIEKAGLFCQEYPNEFVIIMFGGNINGRTVDCHWFFC